MPKIVDASLEFQLIEEAQQLFEKLARLKASLCAVDTLCEQRIIAAAKREIDHYRAQRLAAHDRPDDTTTTRTPQPTSDDWS